MPNCDPSTLANAARCFNCVIPVGDQLAVQSYVLAKLVGYATDSDGANQLANDARCFSCTIPPGDLLQVQTYLISLISETTIAAADLPNAARCFMSCVPLGEQNALKTYLLDQIDSLGGITISTDPAVLVNDARCVSCVVPIGDQTAVQTWLLALLANVDTTDPSGIANSARCYASCIPVGDQIPVQNYLLCQTQAIVTPPCVTPSAPFFVQIAQKGVTDTNTQLSVRWQQLPNTGSLITSYTVKWGTTAGGPYTNDSGPVPISPKFYIATGLTAGTTYYFVVVANSFSGCSSANSAEANGTTTGVAPGNTLLAGLVSYWKLDEAAGAIRADSIGANNVSQGGDPVGQSTTALIIDSAQFTLNQSGLQLASNSSVQFGAGVSKSFSGWFQTTTIAFSQTLISKWSDSGNDREYVLLIGAGGGVVFKCRDLTNTVNIDVTSTITVAAGSFYHVACGYDNTNGVTWIQVNGETRVTTACTGVRSSGVQFRLGSSVDFNTTGSNGLDGFMDEVAMWNRVLSTTEVAQLSSCFSLPGIQAGITVGTDNANRWNTKIQANGGAAIAAGTISAFGTFVDSAVGSGIYRKVPWIAPVPPDNLTAVLTPWSIYGNLLTVMVNSNFVIGDLTVNGMVGNGTTKKLNTQINSSTGLTATNSGLVCYIHTDVAGTGTDIGEYNAAGFLVAGDNGNSTTFSGIIAGAVGRIQTATHGAGYYSCQRVSNADFRLYYASSGSPHAQIGATNVTVFNGPHENKNIYLWCENDPTTVGDAFTANRDSFFAITLGLSSADSSALFTAVQAYLVAKGGGFV